MMALWLSLALSSAPLPADTLRINDQEIIGVAVPGEIRFVPGDVNGDGRVATADIITLVRVVLYAQPMPVAGDTVAIQYIPNDSTIWTFIPTHGRIR